MDNRTYALTDVHGYAFDMRSAAADHICENNQNEDDLDSYISINQILNIIEEENLGYDDENRPLINQQITEDIFETIMTWIHNVGISKLAGQNLIECAWDDELNDMVFWSNQNDEPNQSRRQNMES